MRSREALAIIDKTPRDYNRKRTILQGLIILTKHDENLDSSHIAFHHDMIFAGNFNFLVTTMSEEEVAEMAACGWFYSEDSWAHR